VSKKTLVLGVIFAALLVGACTIGISQVTGQNKKDLYSQVELFSYALTTIQSDYVDEKTPQDLIYGALRGMLSSLDPHSEFMDPDEYKDLKTETEGKFGGLGVEISIKDDLLTVISPVEDSPAWRAGIRAGDRIVKIDHDVTRDMSLDDAVKKLRGNAGSRVTLTIFRENDDSVQDFVITREIIHVDDIKDPHVMDDHIGYVRLTEFRENSYNELHQALEKLKDQGADSLILDLRNNPGGLLDVATRIAEDFLPAGKTIVSTKGRHSSENFTAKSENNSGEFLDWPIVVMINEGSASGSEIVAGALRDNKRAVLVGVKSFGKGSVQSVIPLPDGSGLRLTTARYFTPSGVCINGIGITPDVVVEKNNAKDDDDSDEKSAGKESAGKESGEDVDTIFSDLEHKEDKKQLDLKKKDLADPQLQSAINVIKGIKIYRKFQQK
jgi:carboxyl-terminal processing protease